jgi:hypothetical protein
LKCQKKTVIEVDYGDLDRFIQEVYGHEYEIVADQELGNDCCKSVTVKKEKLNQWEQADLDMFISTGIYRYMLHTILSDLCNRDLLEPGEYVIEISW